VSDDVTLPAWTWDNKARALVPHCPRCAATAVVSGAFLTCNLLGHSHFHQKLGDVLDTTQRRLATEP
jgi:hypothetical protein